MTFNKEHLIALSQQQAQKCGVGIPSDKLLETFRVPYAILWNTENEA